MTSTPTSGVEPTAHGREGHDASDGIQRLKRLGRSTSADRYGRYTAWFGGSSQTCGRGNVTGMTRLSRITVDPAVCHGSPCIRGMRYPVELIVDLLASGMTSEQVLADYADLELDDILAALEFAANVTRTRSVSPISAA